MERKQNKRISNLYVLILALLLMFSTGFSVLPMKADAASVPVSKVQNIANNIKFITFKKGSGGPNGKHMSMCSFIPQENYDDTCSYFVMICPKRYLDKFNITDNYIEKLEENGMRMLKIQSNGFVEVTEPAGKLSKMGIANIMEQNTSLEFAFIYYVEDVDGTRGYGTPHYATYNTLQAREYSDSELKDMIKGKVTMDKNFGDIVAKIKELSDSVWKYVVMGMAAVVVVWGSYVGIRIAVAKKNEEKINAKGMVKSLIIGVIIMFILAMGTPLLINGLASWVK